MHDIKEIRENLKEFSNQIKKRNVNVKFDEILELAQQYLQQSNSEVNSFDFQLQNTYIHSYSK